MGPGAKHAQESDLTLAYEIGKLVASNQCVLLCGGMTGVMEESARGAREAGGLTVGISPATDKSVLNQYIDIPIVTGMNSGRNFINILSSDVVIFIGMGSAGTLSELAYAIQQKKPIFVINASEKLRTFTQELSANSVKFVDSIPDLEKQLQGLL